MDLGLGIILSVKIFGFIGLSSEFGGLLIKIQYNALVFMLNHCVFGLVSCTYNISLTALLNKARVSRAWSPMKFGFSPFKAFPFQ